MVVNANSSLNETYIFNLNSLPSLKNSTSNGYIIKLESSYFKNSQVNNNLRNFFVKIKKEM